MRQSTSIAGCVRRSVGWLVGRSVGWSVTHSFDDPHVAPYWPSWPGYLSHRQVRLKFEIRFNDKSISIDVDGVYLYLNWLTCVFHPLEPLKVLWSQL